MHQSLPELEELDELEDWRLLRTAPEGVTTEVTTEVVEVLDLVAIRLTSGLVLPVSVLE